MSFGMLSHHLGFTKGKLNSFDPPCLLSRKFNGWSCVWDGGITEGMLCKNIPWAYESAGKISTGLWSLARSKDIPDGMSKVINAPEYFIKGLPKGVPVHGELWYNDRLDIIKETVGTKNKIKPMWQAIKLIAFHIKPYSLFPNVNSITDVTPSLYYHPIPFEQVVKAIQQLEINDHFDNAGWVVAKSISDVEEYISLAKNNGWEGIMVSKPSGSYELGRSYNTLKWKATYEREGKVIGYEAGKTGKNIGRVGALTVDFTWDEKVLSVFGGMKHHVNKPIRFNVSGLYDDEREYSVCESIYPIGSEINFTYSGVTFDGVPVSANINRGA